MNQISAPTVLLLTVFALAALQSAQGSTAAEFAAQPESGSSANQLEIGRAYEDAGRFADAEAAYRKAVEIGDPNTQADALAALSDVVRIRAGRLLSLAMSLEDQGRSNDAEAAYLEVLQAGTPQSRPAALDALARLSAPKASSSAAALLDAAKPLEKAERWEDAEALYRQVLQSGSQEQRQFALTKIGELAAIRDSFWEEQFVPTLDGIVKTLLSVGLVVPLVGLVVPLGWLLKSIFRRRYRDHLAIGDFGEMDRTRVPGASFGETLKFMHERMSNHYRPRIIVGNAGKMPVLLGAFSPDVLDLITDFNESLVPFRKWFSKVTHQPGYEISGWTEATWRNIKVCAKLAHNGQTVRQWSETYPLRDWFGSEQDLAYEILLRLKEYTYARAA